MARMWPTQIPRHIQRDPRRSAEIRVYNKLSEHLDDEWEVYYSRPWWGISPTGGERDGEADFIVAHADRGILFIEVKGGRISVDPATGEWTSTDRLDIRRRIKDPVNQAMVCQHRFLERLCTLASWPRSEVRMRYGVVFTDTVVPEETSLSLAGYEKQLFCHSVAFESDFAGWVKGRLAAHGKSARDIGPGSGVLTDLRRLVADPVQLRTSVSRDVEDDLAEMDRLLTYAQMYVLSFLMDAPRAVVEGGAGTGKTVVATEVVARVAERGESVLLLCLSTALRNHLALRLAEWPKVDVMTLGSFRSAVAGPAAGALRKKSWDVVVVDEGQDVSSDSWPSIEGAVAEGGRGPIVFADSNQAVYLLADDLATRLNAQTLRLRANLRNTKRIALASESLYKGPAIECWGPEGVPPEAFVGSMDSARAACLEKLRTLTDDEHVPPSMITILTSSDLERDGILSLLNRAGIQSATALSASTRCVTVESARSFKGLEAPIVLLLADNALARDVELSYVAVTRARSRLFAFGPIAGTAIEAGIDKADVAL